ncbi:MAG: class I SAM-dependent methyltransferase [Fimbriimonadales bacterium]
METRADWHEDDHFWEMAEPLMFDDLRLQSALPETEQVIGLTRVEPGAAVLDLFCGPGRHSIEFARKGYRVAGVDRTQRYLDRARKSAGSLDIEWIRADARQFARPGAFDLAINLYTSFGYFESPDDDLLVASNVAKSLRPGGAFVVQMIGKEVVAKGFTERIWGEHGEITLLQEHKLHHNFTAIENRWTLLTPEGKREIGFIVRLYAATEMESLLRTAGFSDIRFFGSLDGLPYDHNSRRMTVLART